ncbi:hypothetical protein K438DRAFT_1925138 [Mycena galopus ATCC 62051]|nr:hypothetical protein K438DRAFT_1925138 [Mycena galopus ATCC 62051]
MFGVPRPRFCDRIISPGPLSRKVVLHPPEVLAMRKRIFRYNRPRQGESPPTHFHFKEAHPMEICTCGAQMFVDDLPKHYIESMDHPTCLKCSPIIGFKDDVEHSKHGAAMHPESRCTVCRRQFPDEDDLQNHFNTSESHPKCRTCNVGFLDDGTLNEHLSQTHVWPPRIDMAVTVTTPSKDLRAIEAPSANTQISQPFLPPLRREIWNSMNQNLNQVPPTSPYRSDQTPSPGGLILSSSTVWSHDGLKSGGRVETSGSRLFNKATAGVVQNFFPRSQNQIAFPQFDDTPSRIEQAKLPKSLSTRSTSTVSSTSSLSGTFAEMSGSSSTGYSVHSMDKGEVVHPTAFVRCWHCKRNAVDPTATKTCGHVFCNKCITMCLMQTPACPRCEAPTMHNCLLRLYLDV